MGEEFNITTEVAKNASELANNFYSDIRPVVQPVVKCIGAVLDLNQPILDALGGDTNKRYMMHDCVEDVLGYPATSSDKPYRAYTHVKDWLTWDDVPHTWKDAMRQVFREFQDDL